MTQTTRVIISDSTSIPYNNDSSDHGTHIHCHSLKREGWYYLEHTHTSLSGSRTSIGSESTSRKGGPIPCPPSKRTRTSTMFDYGYRSPHNPASQCHLPHHTHHTRHPHHHQTPQQKTAQPWETMAQTYTWVLEQEIAEMAKKNEETVRWVLEQQQRDVQERTLFTMLGVESRYRQLVDDIINDFQREREILKAREEETRRKAWRRQRELERSVQEEMRRLQAKRREAERYRMAYDRRRAYEDARERERRRTERERERALREAQEKKAWQAYQERWTTLNGETSASDPLTFRTIPWPTLAKPKVAEDISPSRVTMFLLSPLHSEDQTRKERIKSALRRWHPDRFGRLLGRVVDEDKEAVEKAVGTVVRCLNNLLEKED